MLKDVSRYWKESFKVSKVFQERFKVVLGKFQRYVKSVSK